MADAEFVVALVDKITGPAKKAMSSIASVADQLQTYSKTAVQASQSTSVMSHVIGSAIHKFEGLSAAYGGFLYIAHGGLAKEWARTTHMLANELHLVTGKLKYGAIAGMAYATMLAHGVWHMEKYGDSARRSLSNLTGSEDLGKKTYTQGVALASELGMSIESTVDSFKELLAMQFKPAAAGELIKLAADLRDVTGDAGAAQRALLAMSQIKAKGRLQGQELTQQLANAGLSTQLVYEALARHYQKKGAKTVTTLDVQKMIKGGKVDADTGLGAIREAIMHKLHEDAPGQAAGKYANTTLQGLLGQVANAPNNFYARVADAAQHSLVRIVPLIRNIVDTIKSIPTGQFATFIDYLVTIGEYAVAISKAFFVGFVDGSRKITRAISNVNPGKNAVPLARKLGELLAEAAAAVVWIIDKVVQIPIYLNEHRWVVWAMLGLYTFMELYQVAFMLSHIAMAIAGAMFVWKVLMGDIVLKGFAGALVKIIDMAIGLKAIRVLVKSIGQMIFEYFVLKPALALGWILLIVGGIYLIWDSWEEAWEAMTSFPRKWAKVFLDWLKSIDNMFNTWATDGFWSEAGGKAAWGFVKGFLAIFWKPFAWIHKLLYDMMDKSIVTPLLGAAPVDHDSKSLVGEILNKQAKDQEKEGLMGDRIYGSREEPEAKESVYIRKAREFRDKADRELVGDRTPRMNQVLNVNLDVAVDATGTDPDAALDKVKLKLGEELPVFLANLAAGGGVNAPPPTAKQP
jgi:hypothetical protein